MAAPKLLAGIDAVRAGRKLAAKEDRRSAWPYVHIFPPPEAVPVHGSDAGIQAAAVPAGGSSVTVCSYRVPSGFRFYMAAILQDFEGSFNPGDTLWTVKVNPNNGSQSRPVQGLTNQPVPLGSWRYGTQWPFMRAYEFEPLDVVQSIAENVNLNSPNTQNYVSGFFGWLLEV